MCLGPDHKPLLLPPTVTSQVSAFPRVPWLRHSVLKPTAALSARSLEVLHTSVTEPRGCLPYSWLLWGVKLTLWASTPPGPSLQSVFKGNPQNLRQASSIYSGSKPAAKVPTQLRDLLGGSQCWLPPRLPLRPGKSGATSCVETTGAWLCRWTRKERVPAQGYTASCGEQSWGRSPGAPRAAGSDPSQGYLRSQHQGLRGSLLPAGVSGIHSFFPNSVS